MPWLVSLLMLQVMKKMNNCPFCDSTGVEVLHIESDGNPVELVGACSTCFTKWVATYSNPTFEVIGTYEGDADE